MLTKTQGQEIRRVSSAVLRAFFMDALARANIRVLERGPATALIDGDHGMGHVVMTYASA